MAAIDEIRAKDGNLSIPLYVVPAAPSNMVREAAAFYGRPALDRVLADWLESSRQLRQSMAAILKEDPRP